MRGFGVTYGSEGGSTAVKTTDTEVVSIHDPGSSLPTGEKIATDATLEERTERSLTKKGKWLYAGAGFAAGLLLKVLFK